MIEEKMEQLRLLSTEFKSHSTRLAALAKRQEGALSVETTEASKAARLLFAEFSETLVPMMASMSSVMVALFEEAMADAEPEFDLGIEAADAQQILEIFDMFQMMCRGSLDRAETPPEMKAQLAAMLEKERAARELVSSLVLDEEDDEDEDDDADGDDEDDDEDEN